MNIPNTLSAPKSWQSLIYD